MSALVCAVLLYGATKLEVETDYLSFFGPSTVVRRDNDRIAKHLGGAQPVYPRARGRRARTHAHGAGDRGDARPAAVHRAPARRRHQLLARGLHRRRAPRARSRLATGLPEQQRDVDQLLLFADPTDLRRWSRATGRAPTSSCARGLGLGGDRASLVDRIVEYAAQRLPGGLHSPSDRQRHAAEPRSADTLARGQTIGLSQELIVLLLVMSALFLSFRTGLLSLVPNVVLTFALFAVMASPASTSTSRPR